MRCVPITVPYERGEAQTAALHDLCRALFPNPSATKLESVEMHDHVNRIQVQILSGGLTNTLLRVEYANTDDENSTVSVVVRVFGPDSERIVDRRMERFFQPLFLHTFGFGVNCLVYEYLSGYRPLESSELSSDAKLQATIAKSLAHFHWKTTTASLLCAAIHNEPPDSDTVLTSWYESCASPVVRQRLAEQKLSSHLDLLLQGLSSCRERLMHTLDMVRAEMPVVICHNDLLAGNIMRRANSSDSCGSDVLDAGSCSARRSEELCLIDFEYTRRNYLYFDFANHFNEYAGFECDWSRFPNQAVQLRFVRDYYTAHFELFAMAAHSSNPTTPAAHHGSTPQHVAAYHYSEERTYALIQFCTLISHVKWILWALLQQAYSPIAYDFITYAQRRYERLIGTMDCILELIQTTSVETMKINKIQENVEQKIENI